MWSEGCKTEMALLFYSKNRGSSVSYTVKLFSPFTDFFLSETCDLRNATLFLLVLLRASDALLGTSSKSGGSIIGS